MQESDINTGSTIDIGQVYILMKVFLGPVTKYRQVKYKHRHKEGDSMADQSPNSIYMPLIRCIQAEKQARIKISIHEIDIL